MTKHFVTAIHIFQLLSTYLLYINIYIDVDVDIHIDLYICTSYIVHCTWYNKTWCVHGIVDEELWYLKHWNFTNRTRTKDLHTVKNAFNTFIVGICRDAHHHRIWIPFLTILHFSPFHFSPLYHHHCILLLLIPFDAIRISLCFTCRYPNTQLYRRWRWRWRWLKHH